MNKIKFLLVAAAISCVPLLNRCIEDSPPVVGPPETTEEILAYLKNLDIYVIGEHSCTVEASTDSYEYPLSLADTYYSYLPEGNNKVPTGLIDTISTLGLMETILENPVWYIATMLGEEYISRFLSTDEDINGYFENINPGMLDEFYGRENAASLLVERYTNMYPTCTENNYSSGYGKGDYPNDTMGLHISTSFMEIQLLMAEDTVLSKLTKDELREVSIHIVKTYISLMENTGVDILLFNIFSLAWMATRIMEANDYQPFNQLYRDWHNSYRLAVSRFRPIGSDNYAQLVLCLNDFIHEEL